MREKKGNKMWKRAIALLLGLSLAVGSVQVIAPREVQAAGSVPEITNDGLYRTVYEENFDDATIESLTADGWDVTSGTTGLTGKYEILDGKLRGVKTATSYYAGDEIKNENKYTCETEVTMTKTDAFTTLSAGRVNYGVVFGRDALDHNVMLFIHVIFNGSYIGYRIQDSNGNYGTTYQIEVPTLENFDRTMKWKVEVSEDAYDIYLNGTYLNSFAYENGLVGGAGTYYVTKTYCTIDFDNLKFSTLNEDVLLNEAFVGNTAADGWTNTESVNYASCVNGKLQLTNNAKRYYVGTDNGFSEYEWDHYTYSADLTIDTSGLTDTGKTKKNIAYGIAFARNEEGKAIEFCLLGDFTGDTVTWTWRLYERYVKTGTTAYGTIASGSLPEGVSVSAGTPISLKVVVGNGDITASINDSIVTKVTPETHEGKYRGNTKGTVGIVSANSKDYGVTYYYDNLVVLPYYVCDNFETYDVGNTPFTTANGWETDSTVSVQEVNGNQMSQLTNSFSKSPKYKAFADGTISADIVMKEIQTLSTSYKYMACLYARFETSAARELRVRFRACRGADGALTGQLNLVVYDTLGLSNYTNSLWQQYYTIPNFAFDTAYHLEVSCIGNYHKVSLDGQTIWEYIAPTDGNMADYSGNYIFATGETTYTASYIDNLTIAEHTTYNIENQCDTYVTPEKYPAIGGDSKSALLARNKFISGEELVFTAESANDYTIAPDTLSYTCVSDSTVTGQLEGSDGTYRFVMPSDDVTLTATTYQVGDIDKSSGIDETDIGLLRSYFVDGGDSFLMDSNEDGTVDARDLIRQTKKETVTDGAYLYIENFEECETTESPGDWQEDYVSASAKDNWEVYEEESANVDFDFVTLLSDLTIGSGGRTAVKTRMEELGFSAIATLGGEKTDAGKLLMRSGNTWYLKNILGSSGWSDYSVEAVVAIGSTNAGENVTYDGTTAVNAGIAAAIDPTTGNGLEWRFTTKNSDGKWLVEINDRAGGTKLKEGIVTEDFALDTDITLKVELSGKIAKFYVNGTCYDTYDASETLTGTAGFTSAGPTMTFTSFNVTNHKDEQKNAGNRIYGTQTTDKETATWLHVFDDNPAAEFEFKVDQTASDAQVGFLIRRAPDTAFVNVGYDFTVGKWFITSQVAEEGGEAVSTTTWGEAYELLKNNWYTAKVTANGSKVVLTIDGEEVVKATDVARVEHGRIGAFTKNAQMYLDNVQIEISSGDVPESGLLSYVLVPNEYAGYMELESPDDGTTLVGMTSGGRWLSSNAGLTWSKLGETSDYSGISISQYSSVIKMHNGQYLQVYRDTTTDETTIADSQIKAQVSYDLKTWSTVTTPVVGSEEAFDATNGLSISILHVNSLTEVKLANGTYRVFCPVIFRIYDGTTITGHYTKVYYSDDNGQTWSASTNTTKELVDTLEESGQDCGDADTQWAESKIVKCSDGTLRMYYSRNTLGYMAYTESTDDGATWSGLNTIDYMPCAKTSFAVYEDPTQAGTYYMLFVYRGTDAVDSSNVTCPRNRICLMKSNNGKDWTFVMNCEWMSLYDSQTNSNGKDLYQILDPSLYVTEDYVYMTFGRSETYVAGDSNSDVNHMAQRCYYIRAEKEQLKGREWNVVKSMQ